MCNVNSINKLLTSNLTNIYIRPRTYKFVFNQFISKKGSNTYKLHIFQHYKTLHNIVIWNTKLQFKKNLETQKCKFSNIWSQKEKESDEGGGISELKNFLIY